MKKVWGSLGADAAAIVLLTVAAYLPSLRGAFVFDDYDLIVDNPTVKASDGLYRFWFTAESPDYRPLTWTFWWLEWRMWDGRATGYHVVNVALHAVDSVLVWMILRRLKIPAAWLAAAVFAIHPVNVATVAWISEQKNTLSMLFYALSILLYLKFDEEGRWRWCGLSLAAFFLALLSKTAVVMLPVVLLGCVWWQCGRVRRRGWLSSVPYFAAALVLALVTIAQHHRALPGSFVRPGSFAARLVVAGRVPWFYLSKALVPINLTVIYPKWEIDASRWVSYVPGIILVACMTLFWWKRRTWGRPLLFGLGYFVVMLFPVLGFFDQGFYSQTLVADHWQYHSIIGVIALAVAAGQSIRNRSDQRSRVVEVLVGAAVVMVLGVATWKRSGLYADSETLWRDNVAKNPGAWAAHNNLGFALQTMGKLGDATAQYDQALRLRPDYAEAHYNLGLVFSQTDKLDAAIREFAQAVRINPNLAEAQNNLAATLLRQGKLTEAVEHLKQALRIKVEYAEAHYNLGAAWQQKHKARDAIGYWEQVARIDPDLAQAHNNLAVVLVRLGRLPEAVGHFEQALRLEAEYAEAQKNLGDALVQAGRAQDATGHWEQVARTDSDLAEAHNNLAITLARLGKLSEAMEHFEQALRVKADDPDTHYNLGVALERAGRTPEAIGQYEQTLRLRPDFAAAQQALVRLRVAQ